MKCCPNGHYFIGHYFALHKQSKMLKSGVGLCNFSAELSPFDVNAHLFL